MTDRAARSLMLWPATVVAAVASSALFVLSHPTATGVFAMGALGCAMAHAEWARGTRWNSMCRVAVPAGPQ